jgi:2,5-diketo-D-gluconate reductase B
MPALPPIGLGTWQNTDPEVCVDSVRTALDVGYRHIDTAQYYENEAAVGAGIARSDIPRDEVVVASKVHPEKGGLSYDDVIEGVTDSLDRLGLDYLDILYVHWPLGDYAAAETMPAFDALRDRGHIEHVGVSNFSVDLLDEARAQLDAPLCAHQAECHPLLPQDDLVAHAQAHDYTFVAYSPLARGAVFDIPEIRAIADDHGVSPAQVSLAWVLARDNVAVIPKASSEAHIRDNFAALDLELSEADLARIDELDQRERYIERDGAPWLES